MKEEKNEEEEINTNKTNNNEIQNIIDNAREKKTY